MDKQTKWVGLAAVGSGIFASVCCLGPVVLAAFGLSGIGLSQTFSPYRPYFLTATFGLLGVAFLYTFKPVKQKEGEVACTDCENPRKRMRTRALLALFGLFALGFASYPNLSGKWAAVTAGSTTETQDKTVVLSLSGMTCPSCALEIQKALKQVPGVAFAKVEYKTKKAEVGVSENVSVHKLIQVVTEKGYAAKLVSLP